ncbi:hypothetical protein C351_05292 [Cryptococcus neoformans c8]|nr:hypothetical protein C353_05363 [Cryptococcus neoformans var. grubii AD1-83a]OXG51896.1 hypothetical protein C354_05305 [Cryptococcus neoformans var. grubii MW-RSA1955]OXG55846.1 hypothetical protein C352_05287 [Cryptococcus neoformans var. grubii CHC193]OXG59523.1 hypothetical protein C351_05292 [Cryptococcus neoformans var. grubii c8]OXH04918.1 hypothetical protein C369_05493 [Cryptococcus neoformans var. grubii A5-35-17]OXH06247.1 hypothetical protein C370_05579 [Cryptococcus neoformans 
MQHLHSLSDLLESLPAYLIPFATPNLTSQHDHCHLLCCLCRRVRARKCLKQSLKMALSLSKNFLYPELHRQFLETIEPHFAARDVYKSTSVHKERKDPDLVSKVRRSPIRQSTMDKLLSCPRIFLGLLGISSPAAVRAMLRASKTSLPPRYRDRLGRVHPVHPRSSKGYV